MRIRLSLTLSLNLSLSLSLNLTLRLEYESIIEKSPKNKDFLEFEIFGIFFSIWDLFPVGRAST